MKKGIIVGIIVVLLASVSFGLWQWKKNSDKYTTQPLTELPVPPLKELAERQGIEVGSFAALKYLRERPYSEILATEFDYAIVDGEPNWKFEDFELRPARDKYDFAHMDQVFDFADQNDMPVRVQHYVWGDEKWLPDWLKNGNYSNEELLAIIREHIQTVGEHYKGRVREYTVVNEAFSRELKTGGNEDWWGKKLGRQYIDEAFVAAKAADPNSILILNDFGNETEGEISNNMYDYIKEAKARGIPIDGLGMQMHISGNDAPSREKVAANMRRFRDLGVKIYVTEFDVNMHDVPGDQEAKDKKQAGIYKDMLGACLDVGSDTCGNFGFLGLVDRQSWYGGIGLDEANPLLFYDDYKPKPAFYAIRETLEKN